ncbi:type I-E CRISPR-associated protein Cse1/CasA [Corynebacterium sp.]|uniref:type I-E CRISPR-associated protein Cse1/CasA n=1 Tax=Corynebacterium sp. TaxID=1720 RepID=UPI0026DAE360|nr:type I-E CRISPR-associated protein Cse1/CasA [Corynebacterium sp.]MDO4610392.1 type I-E CRISPR-associated protein Cse1/CasA [Corynebacterium sp.]
MSFNLIDEPWIRVIDGAGEVTDVGIREALVNAPRYRALAGDMPTQDFAVLRLLLAVVYRAIGFEGEGRAGREEWETIWKAGTLPEAAIDGYLDTWRDRFDLVHPEMPFLQVATLHTQKNEWKGLELIVADSPGPGSMYRRTDSEAPLALGDAARWLLHCMSYDFSGIKSGAIGDDRVKGGRGYPMGIGWCGWLGGLYYEGDTLFHTLLLNTVADVPAARAGLPAWEEAPVTAAARNPGAPIRDGGTGPVGGVTLLTWQQRRLRLRVADGRATGVLVCNGDPVDYQSQYGVEQMTAWRFSAPQSRKLKRDVYMPRALQEDRAMWRGLETLLPLKKPPKAKFGSREVDAAHPAGIVEWTGRLAENRMLPRKGLLRLRAVGVVYGSNMSLYDRMLSDGLAFAPALLTDGGRRLKAAALTAVHRAEAAADALGTFAGNVASAAGGDFGPARDDARGLVYRELDVDYPAWLASLDPDRDPEVQLAEWTRSVRRLIDRHAARVIEAAPPAAWIGRPGGRDGTRVMSVGQAEAWFRTALAKALPWDDGERDTHGDHRRR